MSKGAMWNKWDLHIHSPVTTSNNEFEGKNKICFTSKKYKDLNTIQLRKYKKYNFVLNDSKKSDYRRDFNIYKYINDCFKQ